MPPAPTPTGIRNEPPDTRATTNTGTPGAVITWI